MRPPFFSRMALVKSVIQAERSKRDNVGVLVFDVVFDDISVRSAAKLLLPFAFPADFKCRLANLKI